MQEQDLFNYYRNALQGTLTNGVPLCDEYTNEWRKCGGDKEQLLKLALRQQSIPHLITFASKGKGVGKEFLKKEFGDLINGKYTVKDADLVEGYKYQLYVDHNELVHLNDIDVSAFMWCKDLNVSISPVKCPTIYCGCRSRVTLRLEGYNALRVYLFDSSEVEIYSADETNTVLVYKYSDRCKVTKGRFCLCHDVKEFSKELKL